MKIQFRIGSQPSEYQLSILTSTNNFQVLRTIRPFCRFRSPSRPDEESHPQGYEHFIDIVSGKKFSIERQYLLKVLLFFTLKCVKDQVIPWYEM